MPSTTFLPFKPSKHPNQTVQDLIDEINTHYESPRWFADFTVCQESSFFSERITSSQLYFHLGDGEWQTIHCASCDKTIEAYLLGALNFIGQEKL